MWQAAWQAASPASRKARASPSSSASSRPTPSSRPSSAQARNRATRVQKPPSPRLRWLICCVKFNLHSFSSLPATPIDRRVQHFFPQPSGDPVIMSLKPLYAAEMTHRDVPVLDVLLVIIALSLSVFD